MTACAGMHPATSPDMGGPTLPGASGQIGSVRDLIGIWQVQVDYSGVTVTEVSDRTVETHYNVKPLLKPPKCSDCLKITNVSDDPGNKILSADVTIKNPSNLSAADLRGIVISNHPLIYLANPDDYTTLWDPKMPPNINPFRLFGKSLPSGVIGPGVQVTEHFDLHYNQIPFAFQTAADVVYKISADREPYAIKNQTIAGALDVNGIVPREIQVDVYDRNNDAGTISVYSEEFGINKVLTPDSGKPNHYIGYITNAAKKPVGDYQLLISAADSKVPDVLFDYLTVSVSDQLGEWEITSYPLPGGGCHRDIAAGVNVMNGQPVIFVPGGAGCHFIQKTDSTFSTPSAYFNLVEIDPLVPGFSPYPIKRMDASFTGGVIFCSSSEEEYSDDFYTGPVSSLLLSVYPSAQGTAKYIDYGDGDAGRMYPSNTALRVVDVTDDMAGAIYGLWADPDGVVPPELYGMGPDYTRHDVFMGGVIPANLVGNGPGKISPLASRIKAIDITNIGIESGMLYVLESDGFSSEIEAIQYAVDFQMKNTTFQSIATIPVGPVDAIDMDIAMYNPTYLPNTTGDSLAVLINGSSGGYVKMYNTTAFAFLEDIGNDANPSVPGTPAALDMNSAQWRIMVLNEEDTAVVFSWVL